MKGNNLPPIRDMPDEVQSLTMDLDLNGHKFTMETGGGKASQIKRGCGRC